VFYRVDLPPSRSAKLKPTLNITDESSAFWITKHDQKAIAKPRLPEPEKARKAEHVATVRA